MKDTTPQVTESKLNFYSTVWAAVIAGVLSVLGITIGQIMTAQVEKEKLESTIKNEKDKLEISIWEKAVEINDSMKQRNFLLTMNNRGFIDYSAWSRDNSDNAVSSSGSSFLNGNLRFRSILTVLLIYIVLSAIGQAIRLLIKIKTRATFLISGEIHMINLTSKDFIFGFVIAIAIGAVYGMGIITMGDGFNVSLTKVQLIGAVGIGYAGTDIIGAFLSKNLPLNFKVKNTNESGA